MHINKRVVATITLIVFALGMVFGGALSVMASEAEGTPQAPVEAQNEAAPKAEAAKDAAGVTMTIHSEWYEQDGKTVYTGEKPGVTYIIEDAETGEFKASFVKKDSEDVYKVTVFTPETGKSYTVKEEFTASVDGFSEAAAQTVTDFSKPITFKHTKMESGPSAKISVKVQLDGKKIETQKFTVELKDATSGEVLQSKDTFIYDTILFDPINFKADGTYKYTLQQSIPTDTNGITYDDTVYHLTYVVKGNNVTKTVTKNDDTTAYNGELIFDNKTKVAAPVNLTVKVKWANDSASDRPKDVELQLYYKKTSKDGKTTTSEKEGKSVKVTADDNWTYTWEDLDGDKEWTVKEVSLPSGYTANIIDEGKSGDTLNFTVLNSKGSAIAANGGGKTTAGGAAAVANKGTPQTDDISHLNTWITLAIASLSGMVLVGVMLFINRKKAYSSK